MWLSFLVGAKSQVGSRKLIVKLADTTTGNVIDLLLYSEAKSCALPKRVCWVTLQTMAEIFSCRHHLKISLKVQTDQMVTLSVTNWPEDT